MGFLDPQIGANTIFGAGGALPTGLLPGDEIWIFLTSIGNPTTAFTAPAGWTVVGSETNWTQGRAAIYKHTYAVGDTYPVFTHPSSFNAITFIVRSTGTKSIQTDTTITGTTTGGGVTTVKKFSPAAPATDLRLCFFVWNVSLLFPAFPAVTASGENPIGKPLATSTGTQQGSSAAAGAAIYRSFWADPSGLDANDGTLTTSALTKSYYQRSICLTDGSGISGGLSDEDALYEAVVDVHTAAPDEASQAIESANSNWWGGGASLPADRD